MNTYVFGIKNLDCAHCAQKIQEKVAKSEGIERATVVFASAKMVIESEKLSESQAFTLANEITGRYEQGAYLVKNDAKPEKEEKNRQWIPLGIGAVLFVAALILDKTGNGSIWFYLLPYVILGYDVVLTALKNLFSGQLLDENFLMALASIGAFAIDEALEGVAVMLFFSIGEYFQDRAVDQSRKSIEAMSGLRPEIAHVIRQGSVVTVSPDEVEIGETILIKAGEKVPIDAMVTDGESFMDMSAINGESVPRKVQKGDEILGGYINGDKSIKACTIKTAQESASAKILDLIADASQSKTKTEKFITKFSKVYTPCVVGAALIVAFIVPLILGEPLAFWVQKALNFLVVSCPCALVISVPLAYYAGLGMSAKRGILVKGGNHLEALARVEAVACDKTGTLTKGVFEVSSVVARGMEQEELLRYAGAAEAMSNHPIAKSIVRAVKEPLTAQDAEEIPGMGVQARVAGKEVLCGNAKLFGRQSIAIPEEDRNIAGCVYAAIGGEYCGYIVVSDVIRPDTKTAIETMKQLGVREIGMLTGDAKIAAEAMAKQAGVDWCAYEQMPKDKLEHVQSLKKKYEGTVAFVGDGINDAPVLSGADIGIAMGAMGQDAAIESADAVLVTDELTSVADGIRIGRYMKRIIHENISFSLGVKAAVLFSSLIFTTPIWLAIFADVGVALIAVVNSIRVLHMK